MCVDKSILSEFIMCGIFGIVSSELPENKAIKDALDTIKHRGPDDEGFLFVNPVNSILEMASGADTCSEFKDTHKDVSDVDTSKFHLVLGNRRLAIIDLSPKGHQPMCYADGCLWITYNGEIFNYKELRTELKSMGYRFHSDTDTEVILSAYTEWGEECVKRFNGQWAFCIYDGRRKRLFCSRDRFGIKPFYYWFDGKHFAFASEIKALLKLPFVKTEINKPLISDFVVFSRHHTRESLYKGIYQLLPSHNLTIDLKKINLHISRYYELYYNDELGRYNHKQALKYADDIRDLLIDAVKIRLVSDVPLGSCLSGGLDSSSIVVIINRFLKEGGIASENIGEEQKTFTASYDDPSVDEKIHADEIIRHTDVKGFFVYPTAEKLWRELDSVLYHHDGVFHATNTYAGWNVMRLASGHVKVVLNGQGGDELFGGYCLQYEPIYVADMLKRMRFKDLNEYLIKKSRLYNIRVPLRAFLMGHYFTLIPDSLKIFLYKQRNKDLFGYVKLLLNDGCFNNESFKRMKESIKSLNYRLWSDLTGNYLPQLLLYDDRNSAAFSIESRVPFTDYRLVEYVNRIPSIYKLHNGSSKWLLRLAMRDLLPDKILWRRDKIGFSTPEETWIKHKDSPIPSLMNRYGIKDYSHLVWRLYLAEKLINT